MRNINHLLESNQARIVERPKTSCVCSLSNGKELRNSNKARIQWYTTYAERVVGDNDGFLFESMEIKIIDLH